jgi:hypothetical protein
MSQIELGFVEMCGNGVKYKHLTNATKEANGITYEKIAAVSKKPTETLDFVECQNLPPSNKGVSRS